MKTLLTLLLIINMAVFCEKTSATTYYFSTSDGDDARSTSQAQSSGTPWKTISKLNSILSSLQAGDQVLFKRGDVFSGSISLSKSGSSSAPIVFDAYGSGNNPVITGLTTVSGWTSAGNGLYQATVSGGLSSCNIVTVDGNFQAISKMPKGNSGYYTTTSGSGTAISGSGMPGTSFSGGEVVWRPNTWVLWRGTITSQSGSTVNFSPLVATSGGGTENPVSGYGFFFQNSPAACTQFGEWAYNGSSHVLTMYFGSESPTSHTIQAANIDNLITANNQSNITFNNIALRGANTTIFTMASCSNIKINSCAVSFAGVMALAGSGSSSGIQITNNTITWTNSIGIRMAGSCTNWTIQGNSIDHTGSIAGMGGSGEGQYFGIKIDNASGNGNGTKILLNNITNSGYIPVMFNGTNALVQNNYIDTYGFVKDDVAGIYCDISDLSGSKIDHNIVLNGIGAPTGGNHSDYRAFGIYADDGANNLEISGNTVAFMGRAGIYVHNGHELNIHDNTLFDNHTGSCEYYNDKNTIANITYTGNINFAKTSSELVYISSAGNAPTAFFTTLDNNYYCRPMNENNCFQTSTPNAFYNLASWKSYIGKDAHSSATPSTITDTSQLKFYYNNTNSTKSFSFGATYIDVHNTSYSGSVTLQPYTSIILKYSSGTVTNQPPVANAGSAQIIIPPLSTALLDGTKSTDPDGKITAYQWTKVSGPASAIMLTPNAATTSVTTLTSGVFQFELKVTDDKGATGKDTVTITVNGAANQAPSANAGGDVNITLPLNSVSVTGSGSDNDGTIDSYLWTKTAGPSTYAISSPTQAKTNFTNLVEGIYTFQLTVTDNSGATSTDNVQITVNAAPPNQSPSADAGSDASITLPLNTVTLSGSGTDPDGSIANYQWTEVSGPTSYSFTTPTRAQTTVNNLVEGVYQFRLTVTDDDGATGSDMVTVNVSAAPNQLPTASAGADINVTLPVASVTLQGSGSDPDGNIAGYRWTETAGPSGYSTTGATQAQPILSNLAPGTYQFQLTVTDNSGGTATDAMTLLVNAAPNELPTADAGADVSITLPQTSVTLNGDGNDPDGNIQSFQWSRISGPSQYSIVSSDQPQTVINNLVAGTYQFQLTVTDNSGATASDVMTLIVNSIPNDPPTADAGQDITITLPTNSVTLTGGGSDDDGNIVAYQWTKLSGPSSSRMVANNQAQITVNNLAQGTFRFELEVTDNSGATATDTVLVTVNAAPNEAPTVDAGADVAITLPTNGVSLRGTGNDPDGNIDSWQWSEISGPSSYSINTPTRSRTSIDNLVEGTYQFQLTVTDNSGATTSDVVTVLVNPAPAVPNEAPVADAGSDITITLPTSSVTLNGSGTDADGTVASYQWVQVAGPDQFNIISATQGQTDVKNLVQGSYQFALFVTDDQGTTSSDTVSVTVNPGANKAPTLNAGADVTITLPANSTTLTGTANDADGNIASYQWTKIAGPSQYNLVSADETQTIADNLAQGVYQFELMVTDNEGAIAKDTITVMVNPAVNIPPSANAGQDITITLPDNTVTLNGSAGDLDGFVTNYQWKKIAGPAQYTIVSSGAPQTLVNNLAQGAYQFELTATDDKGATGADTVTVIVIAAANQAPVADAGADITITLPTNSTTLNGSASDPDGTIATYQWTKISGPFQYNVNNSNQAQATARSLAQGTYKFELKVKDNAGAFARDTVTVTVNAAVNVPPVADAGSDVAMTLPTNSVNLAGQGTDANGSIVSYTWTKVAGPTKFGILSPSKAKTTINNLAQGVYKFRFTVMDNAGATASDTVQVTVNAAGQSNVNQKPSANAGNDITIALPSSTVTLTGTGTDADGSISAYSWTKVAGPTSYTMGTASLSSTSVKNLVEGTYRFVLTVTDNKGATGSDTVSVIVANIPNQLPTASAGFDVNINLPLNSVSLSGSGTDPDGTIAFYQWTKISGPSQYNILAANQAKTTISGLAAGIYVLVLKVTDDRGGVARDTMQINVSGAANKAPKATAGNDITITLPTNNVTLNGTGNDPDGSIAAYKWTKLTGPDQFSIVTSTKSQTKVNNLAKGVYQFELTVADNVGATAKDTIRVTVMAAAAAPPTNKAPVANAGADINVTFPGNSATLNGSGTDADGTIAAYKWTVLNGPAGYSLPTSDQAQVTITQLVSGEYQVELKVTDNRGAVGKDTMSIFVDQSSATLAKVYPNPATDNISIQIKSTKTGNSTMRIYDAKGTPVYSESFSRTSLITTKQVRISNLPNGMYYIEMNIDDNKITTLPFAKQ